MPKTKAIFENLSVTLRLLAFPDLSIRGQALKRKTRSVPACSWLASKNENAHVLLCTLRFFSNLFVQICFASKGFLNVRLLAFPNLRIRGQAFNKKPSKRFFSRLIFRTGLFSVFLLLASCAHRRDDLSSVQTDNLASLQQVRVHLDPASPGSELSQIRINALRDVAMGVGAQGGLSYSANIINQHLDHDSTYLESIFNFNTLLLNHGVLPPVLEEGTDTLNQENTETIRIADHTYKIISPARFATTPPNWREYLWMNYPKPKLPDKTLLPKTAEEQAIWQQGVTQGWELGIEQAKNIFQQNLARLKRDVNGIILYRKLLQRHMISAPFVAKTELGVTGDHDVLRVNDQVLRIVQQPQLQTDGSSWKAIVVRKH